MHYSFIMHLNFRDPFDAGGKKSLSRIFPKMFYEKDCGEHKLFSNIFWPDCCQ